MPKTRMISLPLLAMLCILLAPLPRLATAQELDDRALTPPMGWNSWNKFGCDVSDQLIRETADAMVSSGMRDAGYEYVVIDDCWQVERDSEGNIVVACPNEETRDPREE